VLGVALMKGVSTARWAAKRDESRAGTRAEQAVMASVGQTSRSAADLLVGPARATFNGAA
jgi:hypothetical protein